MKLIAGLGNPGPRYFATRHNAGFTALDTYLEGLDLNFDSEIQGSPFLRAEIEGVDVLALKPMRYMNRSGGPVGYVMRKFDLAINDLLVIHDDIDIKPGEARYKINGGHGGHNGIKSIANTLNSSEFARIRIGVGRPPDGVDPADYVLSEFTEEETEPLFEAFEKAFEHIKKRFLTA